jgi:hypothetical protein
MNIKVKDGKFVDKCPPLWNGNFDCDDLKLTSLEGVPTSVGGSFYCSRNMLTSLEGAPHSIGGSFYCFNNNLSSLKGSPVEIGDDFDCSHNQFTSIQNINHHIKKIGGTFCSDENLIGLISLLLIEHPPTGVHIGPLSDIFDDALTKIHSGHDRMDVIMGVILNTLEEHAWRLGDIE